MPEPLKGQVLYTPRGQALGQSPMADDGNPECSLPMRPLRILQTKVPQVGMDQALQDDWSQMISRYIECLDQRVKERQEMIKLRGKIVDSFLKKQGIITREQWSKSTIDRSNMALDWGYEIIVIHHSGNWGERNPLDIERKHLSRPEYQDMGYHFMVHPDGTIYEGRNLLYKGAHVDNANSSKIGILVMGDFDPGINNQYFDFDDQIAPKQMETTKKLINALVQNFPTITTLAGHRDYNNTECPGNLLYAELDKLRKATNLNAPRSERSITS